MRKIFLQAACIMLQAFFLQADDVVLTLPGEAKGAALGEAYSASASGAEGIWYNPATLSRRDAPSLSLMHTSYLESVTLDALGAAVPFGRRYAVGGGISYLNVGSIASYDNTGSAVSSYSPKDFCARVGLSKSLENTSFGLSVFFLQSTIVNTASTFGFNAGLHHAMGPLALALVGENFGGKLTYQKEAAELPQRIKIGGSVHLLPKLDVNAEVFRPKSGSTWFGTGVEYLLEVGDSFGLVLRSGYNSRSNDINGLHGISAGAGFGVKGSELNYAWVPFGDLGQTHRLSLDTQFGSDAPRVRPAREARALIVLNRSPKLDHKQSQQITTQKAAFWPALPWKKYRGWRTSKQKVMDLLARDALCTGTSARAIVTRVVGSVELKVGEELNQLRRIRAGQYLFEGDRVRTYANASAQLVFTNGVKAEVGPNTVFSVESAPQVCEHARVSLETGKIYASAEPGKSLKVKTPSGDRHIEGSEEWVSYEGSKLNAESPRDEVHIAEPNIRKTPGRWDSQFSKNFTNEVMRLDSVPGLALAEYVRDTTVRDELKLNIYDRLNERKDRQGQAISFKEDVEGFVQLKAALEKPVEGETRKARKERQIQFKQASQALKHAQRSLKGLQKELKTLMITIRENQEYLAAIPIVRMLNITARDSTIPFEKGRAAVPEEAYSVLDSIADSMVQMKPFRVVVEGHTDKSGSGRSNVRLSRQRAEAVTQYLRKKTGLPARLFITKGMGSSQPLETGADGENMAKNRRVEIWFELRGL